MYSEYIWCLNVGAFKSKATQIYSGLSSLINFNKIDRIGIVVGGEGGISENEILLLEKEGFNLVHFKTNILRAETASLYGIATIQTAFTELDEWHTHE